MQKSDWKGDSWLIIKIVIDKNTLTKQHSMYVRPKEQLELPVPDWCFCVGCRWDWGRQMACGGLNQSGAGVCEGWGWCSWSGMKLHGDKHGQLSQSFVPQWWEIGGKCGHVVETVIKKCEAVREQRGRRAALVLKEPGEVSYSRIL